MRRHDGFTRRFAIGGATRRTRHDDDRGPTGRLTWIHRTQSGRHHRTATQLDWPDSPGPHLRHTLYCDWVWRGFRARGLKHRASDGARRSYRRTTRRCRSTGRWRRPARQRRRIGRKHTLRSFGRIDLGDGRIHGLGQRGRGAVLPANRRINPRTIEVEDLDHCRKARDRSIALLPGRDPIRRERRLEPLEASR